MRYRSCDLVAPDHAAGYRQRLDGSHIDSEVVSFLFEVVAVECSVDERKAGQEGP